MARPVAEGADSAAAYQRATVHLRAQVAAAVAAIWRSLGEWRNAQMPMFTSQVVPVVLGAQQHMGALTVAHLAAQRQAVLGGTIAPVAVDPTTISGASVRNGVDPVDVYGRPFHLVWRQLGDGVSPDDAIQAGLDRAVQSATTDLQLAKTHTAAAVLAGDRHAAGYRRVLEGAHSCALCVIASTQRYHKSELLPIHPQCDCAVAPIWGDSDPGHVVDEARLEAAHQAIAQMSGSPADRGGRGPVDYRKLLIVHDHGELGPVLAVRGRPFTHR